LKSLPGTNTLAQYKNSYIMDVKSFITLAPGQNIIQLFTKFLQKILVTDALETSDSPKNTLAYLSLM